MTRERLAVGLGRPIAAKRELGLGDQLRERRAQLV
jgi:hypothetical protein